MTTRIAGAIAAVGILALLAGGVGYRIGVQVGAGPRVTEVMEFRGAVAQTGDSQATATVDGTSYGMYADTPWVDVSGSWHDNGWPTCLPQRSQSRITFGGATVYGPTGAGTARILWVDCRTTP